MKRRALRQSVIAVVAVVGSFPLLAQSPASRYPLPVPKYEVRIERDVMIPMRDGVRLATDLYFPKNGPEPFAVILIRTPYDKNFFFRSEWIGAHLFSGQGYAVAVQDSRGKFSSEGVFTLAVTDGDDGEDTVDWLASQGWSSGKVGTYGCSHLAESQMVLARRRNPRLVAMVPQAGGWAYRPAVYYGGVQEFSGSVRWFRAAGSKYNPQLPASLTGADRERVGRYFNFAPVLPPFDSKLLETLPVADVLKRAGSTPTDYEDWVTHEPHDSWWDRFGYVEDDDRFDVPVLHVNSWYDFKVGATLQMAGVLQRNAESERARSNQFIVIGPTTHCRALFFPDDEPVTVAGQLTMGDARFDYFGLYLRWFDAMLKGEASRMSGVPKVQVYVMGRNQWTTGPTWPLPQTKFTKYYLHSGGRANSRFGEGVLSPEAPADQPPDQFVYDPATPVPTVGGSAGPHDQSTIETRQDVLVYTTPPLTSGLEITGPLEVVLYVSSSAVDTDFTGKLVDVHPDGRAFDLQQGIIRARYREGLAKPVWMKPGEVYQVRIDLGATANYFQPGHRVRLEISSSNFPRFDRNLNTGGRNYDETQWKVATNTVHHSKVRASHIVLPVIP